MRRSMHTLALLCLGTSINGMEVSQDTTQASQSKGMIASLVESELNLQLFKSGDDEEENADDTTNSQTEEEADDEEDDDEQSNVQTQNEVRVFGRNQEGMFNNHQSYVKLRNKVNQAENEHSQMFDIIKEKLSDQSFIQQAIEMNVKVDTKSASQTQAPTVSSKSEGGMSDADVKCYEGRYNDLDGKTGRVHFLEVGSEEGRLPTCATNLTRTMAQRYLNVNPDLQHSLGRGGPVSQAKARSEYTDTGYTNKDRSIEVPDWDKVWLCGDNSLASCKCKGTVHYGYGQTPDNNSTVATLDKMREWKTYEVNSDGLQWTTCSHTQFGMSSEPDPFQQKQCFCEPEMKKVPTHCGDDGSECLCDGLVFYLKKGSTPALEIDFYNGMRGSYTANNVNGTGKITCGKQNFEGVNPLPGEEKMCMCDNNQLTMNAATVQQVKEYWRTQLEEIAIKERKIELAAAEKAAHEKALADEAAQAAQLKIKIAAQKAAQAAAAQAAAAAKAEEETRAAAERAEEQKEREAAAAEAKKQLAQHEAAHKAAEEEKQKARDAKAAALKLENEEAKNAALEAAEVAEKKAIEDALKAATESKAAEHAIEVAALAKKQEAARAAGAILQKAEDAKKAAEAAEAQKEADAQEAIEDAARAKLEEQKRAQHASEVLLKYEQDLGIAMERAAAAMAAKYASEQAMQAKQQAEDEAAAAAEQAAKDEQARIANEAEAAAEAAADAKAKEEEEAEAALAKQKADAVAAKQKLAMEAHEKAIAAAKAKDAVNAAQQAEALAGDAASVAEAVGAQKAAQVVLDAANAAKAAVLAEQTGIDTAIKQQEDMLALAKKEKDKAKETTALAKEHAAVWAAQAAATKARAQAAIARATELNAQQTAAMKAQILANEAEHAASVAAQQAAFLAQQAALRAAHEAEEAERIALENRQIAEHKRLMAERRARFEKRFKHVWTTGPTGVSKFHVTVNDFEKAQSLIANCFAKTLIADVEQNNLLIERDFVSNPTADLSEMARRHNVHRITGVTSDDRVAELIEEVYANGVDDPDVPFDFIITVLATGSPDYIDWVKLQTMKKDPSVAFYNEDPEAEIKGLNNRVGQIAQITDLAAVESEHLH